MNLKTKNLKTLSEFGKICAKYPDKAREIITGSLNAIATGQYVFIESTAEGREGYFYEMCKEAQAAKDINKALSPLDFRFHFFPWHGHTAYRIRTDHYELPSHMQGYFSQLEAILGYPLELAQKAWYIKRAETQGDDMKREFPSTPAEAFEASNEGLYYGRQMVETRQHGRIRRVYYDANVPVHTAWLFV